MYLLFFYIYKHVYKLTFNLSIQNGRLPRRHNFAAWNDQCILPFVSCSIISILTALTCTAGGMLAPFNIIQYNHLFQDLSNCTNITTMYILK